MRMQKAQSTPVKEGFGVQDVLYVLFKHKWLILLFSLLGFGAATAAFLTQKPIYQSKAKLLVRYIRETGTVDPFEDMQSPVGGGKAGNSVIDTEIEILNSADLALDVADAVGVGRLLPEAGAAATLSEAAGLVSAGFEVEPGHSSNVIYVSYRHGNSQMSKDVLTHLVDRYFKKHLEIHRSAAAFDVVAKQLEDARGELKQTEVRLNRLRTETGIMSLSDATGALSSQRSKTQEDLIQARAELAEKMAMVKERDKESENLDPSFQIGNKGGVMGSQGHVPPFHVITEYRSVTELLGFLQKRDLELRIKFMPSNRLIALNRQQMENGDTRRRGLEQTYPELVTEVALQTHDTQNPQTKLIIEKAGLVATRAKIEVLNAHLKEIGEQFGQAYAVGAQIEEIQRQRDIEDAEYRALEINLKNARIDQTLDPSRMPNITIVQQPSEPTKTFDAKTMKIILGIAVSGVISGLAMAFLIELLFNRSIRRPMEIQARLQLPLLLSIPSIPAKGRRGLLLSPAARVQRIGRGGDSEVPIVVEQDVSESDARKANHFILPYTETIRDRIIFNFEVNNVTHKPKLLAVTGLSEGAGASTIAAGLAKSFSEIKGAKVLLVDLSSFHPEENPLFGEIPRHSLNGALQLAKNTKFKEAKQKLYYASAMARRDDSGLTAFSPLHLYELMPQLQASDFDYIIFDMPPINKTSHTLTMAGLMDKVLLVLDAENTSRDGLVWGYSELVKGRADVSCIFNKTCSHVPSWLIGDN